MSTDDSATAKCTDPLHPHGGGCAEAGHREPVVKEVAPGIFEIDSIGPGESVELDIPFRPRNATRFISPGESVYREEPADVPDPGGWQIGPGKIIEPEVWHYRERRVAGWPVMVVYVVLLLLVTFGIAYPGHRFGWW